MNFEIAAWHFRVDLPHPYGRAMNDCYVRAAQRQAAADLLLACHPRASFRADKGTPLTVLQLQDALGPDVITHDGSVHCIPV